MSRADVEFVEKPVSMGYRFQYSREEWLWGISSTDENKTFPCIKISKYKGKARIRLSCVTTGPAYSHK